MPRIAELGLELNGEELAAFDARVRTLDHFLSTPVQELEVRAGPSNKDVTEKVVATMLRAVEQHVAPQPTSGTQLMEMLAKECRLLPTGCRTVDALLHGGLREGQHTEVIGGSGTGKTQLCHMAAVSTAARGERVVYIDTAGQFSATRAAQLQPAAAAAAAASFPKDPATGQPRPPTVEETLGLIQVHRAHDAYAVLAALESVIVQEMQPLPEDVRGEKIALIVVDSPTTTLMPGSGGGSQMGQAIGASLGRLLRHIADAGALAVLTTNWTTQEDRAWGGHGGGGSGEPEWMTHRGAMGESWRAQAAVRVHLAREGDNREDAAVSMVLTQSPLYAPLVGGVARFRIRPEGLVGIDG
ncbi:unnamed protein product [Pedinophyceae sp. YPF-701]|nr:unnamed protein product [Pedinophyceae sp. YPF-701]